MKKIEWNSKYKTISVYVIITAFIIICIALIMVNLGYWGGVVNGFISIIAPFIIGFAAAYLLARPCVFLERKVFGWLNKNKPRLKLVRILSILLLFAIVGGIVFLLTYFLVPDLKKSLKLFMNNLPAYLLQTDGFIGEFLNLFDFDTTDFRKDIHNFTNSFLDIAELFKKLMEKLPELISSLGTGLLNLFVGMIVCVYALFSREKFARQSKKLLFALFKPRFAHHFLQVLKYSNNVFLGYIMGTLASTAFIGISTFVFLSLFKMPYPLLITVIISLTNIIPFFGPFLGAIPSVLLLFTFNPWYALFFIIFILILQQIDGNIVLPKLVSMNTGLSAFWVLFALILFGGLFGFWGLVLGVPVFAVIYSLIATAVNNSLNKKGIPAEDYNTPGDFES